jgi:hypothetical protein
MAINKKQRRNRKKREGGRGGEGEKERNRRKEGREGGRLLERMQGNGNAHAMQVKYKIAQPLCFTQKVKHKITV